MSRDMRDLPTCSDVWESRLVSRVMPRPSLEPKPAVTLKMGGVFTYALQS